MLSNLSCDEEIVGSDRIEDKLGKLMIGKVGD
jgi:hypothetical protein